MKDTPGNDKLILETLSLSIGIKDSAESRTSSPPMSINKAKSFTSEQETPDSLNKWSNKAINTSSVLTKAQSASRPWSKSIRKRKESSTRRWMWKPWISTKVNLTPFWIRLLLTPFWYFLVYHLVRREFNSQRKQDDFRSLSCFDKIWNLHLRIIRPTRIQTELSLETRIRMDC